MKWETLFEVTNPRHVLGFHKRAARKERWSVTLAFIYLAKKYPEIVELRSKGEIRTRSNGAILQFGIEHPDDKELATK